MRELVGFNVQVLVCKLLVMEYESDGVRGFLRLSLNQFVNTIVGEIFFGVIPLEQ
jgi:hypothetical protein